MSQDFTTDAMPSENDQQHEMAMDSTNGGGSMDHHNGTAGQTKPTEDEDERKLFIGGLSGGTTVEDIKRYFSQYGEVAKVDLKYDIESKKSRGFGFVTFVSSQPLVKILEIGTHEINGRNIDPKKAMARPKPPPMKKVFVGGLNPEVSEQAIREHFIKHGAIEKVELPMDKENNKRRQFCFIVFETEEAAKAATKLSKQRISNMVKECDVKLATPPPPKDGGGRFPGMGMGGGRFGPPGGPGGRGRGRGGFQGQGGPWGNQYGGPNQGYGGGYGPNQGYGGGYDYSGYGGYSGGYGNNYDNSYSWNYGQGGGGGGYNQQNSGYGKVNKRGAGSGSQGFHPYSQ